MNIKKTARKFVKECNLKDLSFKSLEIAVEKLGFELVRFNQFDIGKITELSKTMKIPVSQFERMAFTYDFKSMQIIYVRDFISEKDFATLILHEICHILLGHTKNQNNIYTTDVQNEREANAFSEYTADYTKRYNKKKSVTKKVSLPLTLISCSLAITVALLHISNNFKTHSDDLSLSQNEIVTKPKTTTHTTTRLTTKQNVKDADTMTYYITKTGNKYHLQGCRHIVGRDVIEGTKEDFEKVGYEPCADCISNG